MAKCKALTGSAVKGLTSSPAPQGAPPMHETRSLNRPS